MSGDLWAMAVAAFRRGQLGEARVRCEQIIGRDAAHAGAWQLLGLVGLQTRELDFAVRALERSLQLQPNQPATLVNLGVTLRSLGRFQEALSCYDRALALQPDLPEALSNRANVLVDLRRYAEAMESCDRALRARPGYAEAFNNKGNALQGLGRSDEALGCFAAALQVMPRLVSAHNNRAVALLALQRPADALAACDSALGIDERYADAHNNRGIALKDLGRLAEALLSCERALALHPALADAHMNRGSLLHMLGRDGEALESFERALLLKPDDPTLLCNRAATLRRLGRLREALSGFERAVEVGRGSTLALHGKGEVLAELGRYEEAVACLTDLLERAPDTELAAGHLLHCRLSLCDWTDYKVRVRQLLASVERGELVVAPFWFLAVSGSGALQLQCARIFAAHQSREIPAGEPPRGYGHDKIRVGYLSADFRDHPLARLMIRVWEQHDRSRFETCAISLNGRDEGVLGRRVQAAFDRFEDASRLSDDEVAGLIRRLEIDILVDLGGFTTGMRPGIRARRPAPVQVNYLGYPGTVGGSDTDYIIGDAFVTPESSGAYYSERVVRLPVCFQASDSGRATQQRMPTRQEAGLPSDALVLCSFNNCNKLTPEMFAVWMRLLQRAGNSVLWIVADQPAARMNLRREASQRGVDPERLIFAPRKPYLEHLARLRLADLFLDTFPFNGGSTASDALSAGVPLLTCAGEAFASRMAGSLLRALGLPELIAGSLEEYERIGQGLLDEPGRLVQLRSRLVQQQVPDICRDLEAAFSLM